MQRLVQSLRSLLQRVVVHWLEQTFDFDDQYTLIVVLEHNFEIGPATLAADVIAFYRALRLNAVLFTVAFL